jgi:Protein of unknown function (DUF2817)
MEKYWSEDYKTATDKFCDAAIRASAVLEKLEIAAKGPHGETLAISIAWLGDDDPEKVILHSSGMHGVEGFAGSAIQVQALENSNKVSPKNALVFVHCLNPYGLAWLRRVNENNVDLNRNYFFEDENLVSQSKSVYGRLNPLLNPEKPPVNDELYFTASLAKAVFLYGFGATMSSIVIGQYEYERGLFFGGREMQLGTLLYKNWLSQRLGRAKYVLAIDTHSGLGKMNEEVLMVESSKQSARFNRLVRAFGNPLISVAKQKSVGYTIKGGYPSALGKILPNSTVDFITEEFGTHSSLKILYALREENSWFHSGDKNDPRLDQSTQRLKDMFNPSSEIWRSCVLSKGSKRIFQACSMVFDRDLDLQLGEP